MGFSIPAGIGALFGGGDLLAGLGLGGAAAGEAAAASAPLDLLAFGGGDAAAAFAPAVAAGAGIEGGSALGAGLAAEGALPAGAAGIPLAGGLDSSVAGGLGLIGGEAALPAGATPTSFSPGSGNAFDNLASGATPSGSPLGTTGTAPVSSGAGAVSAPAGVNAPVDATSVAPTTQGGIEGTGGFNFMDAAAGQPGVNGAPAAPGGGQGLLGTAGNAISRNPVGTALAAGGLGYNILQGQKNSAAVNALESQAAQAAATGATLQSYLTNGTLPPAIQAQVSQATAAARARILANYQNTPGGADPTKNSALAQELNNLEIQAIATAGQLEQQMSTEGLQASGLSSNIYSQLAQIDATQTANIGKSIASMAAALSPGGGTTIKLTT